MNPAGAAHYKINSYVAYYGNCYDLILRLLVGPVTVAMDADSNFSAYSSGILNTCGKSVNHSIQIIGVNLSPIPGQSYYIGKNQWGTWWGDKGYIKMLIDPADAGGNICNICSEVSYVI